LNPDDLTLKNGLHMGDKAVYKHLFMLYSPGLIRYGTSLTRDEEATRELIQDLFLDIWENRESIVIRDSIKTYLYSSVYHKGLNWLRSKKIREIYTSNPVEISNWFAYPVNTEKADPLLLEIIEREISLLPEQCREVFTRSVILGDSHSDIAGFLGITIKTVENHLGRARKTLRMKLKKIR
jgi:RNA polymerase sigma-70 factor (ECF subfamily)